jgi:thiol-disulfide isomerase/thioredoxin
MKQLFFFLILLLSVSACSVSELESLSNQKLEEVPVEQLKLNSHAIGETELATSPDSITARSSLDDFKGKISVILFGGTYCAHCRQVLPRFKTQVWDVYKNQANLWVNVIDGGTFDVEEVAQGLNLNLDYNHITNSKCDYVPSWLIMNKEGQVVLKSCGSEKTLEDMISQIKNLIK